MFDPEVRARNENVLNGLMSTNPDVREKTASDVNDYLRTLTEEDFTAKDFRTWAGTVLALDELLERGEAPDEKAAQKQVVEAVKAVAEQLGNTPQVCRAYYIHPAILDAYANGELFEAVSEAAAEEITDAYALGPDEYAVLLILKRYIE